MHTLCEIWSTEAAVKHLAIRLERDRVSFFYYNTTVIDWDSGNELKIFFYSTGTRACPIFLCARVQVSSDVKNQWHAQRQFAIISSCNTIERTLEGSFHALQCFCSSTEEKLIVRKIKCFPFRITFSCKQSTVLTINSGFCANIYLLFLHELLSLIQSDICC